jgi:hypothetical protein
MDQLKEHALVINLASGEIEIQYDMSGKNCFKEGGGWEYTVEGMRRRAMLTEKTKKETGEIEEK